MFIKTKGIPGAFLEALRAGIRGQRVAWKERSVQEWSGFCPGGHASCAAAGL